ncbi:hypothetical protein XENTR_v10001415 [Xenopus tropicalis]|uniref:FYN-binding protein 1 isoform X1 n=2 Tax=Xenopus tropicalis TaxID=8364 RepID=A0A803JEE4_XENTR|nr:FYN-binding protein 1 isoform X1 [Xenopus tropicalis]KAE8632072.1 hypothetical protein XENTR_v10001415 [Xenopus tropicalis]|eukprot:XP_002934838.1 PREDICTED: FYN-binding protein-like [Xenopus tropicalis]
MAETEDFKSLRSRFQKNVEDNKIKLHPPSTRTKPTIPIKPIKPNVGTATNQVFPRPLPKSTSSPELPQFSSQNRFKTTGNNALSHQSFTSRSNLKVQTETSEKNVQNNSNAKPTLPIKPLLPKPGYVARPSVDMSTNPSPKFNTPPKDKFDDIPKLKLLPSKAVLGPKPKKPARPPYVDLDKFKPLDDFGDYVVMRSNTDVRREPPKIFASHSQPNLATCSPSRSIRRSVRESQEFYEDVIQFSPFRNNKAASLQNFVIPEACADETYDDVDLIMGSRKTSVNSSTSEASILITNWRNDMNLKRTEKLEKEFRKKFQFHGEIKILTRMMVDPNAVLGKLGDKDLLYTKGEILDVIQLTNTDKILCRNCEGKFGYVPRKAVLKLEKNIYNITDIDDTIYDDTELISNTFPAVPAKAKNQQSYLTRMFQRNSSQSRNQIKPQIPKREKPTDEEREAKDLKKRFKFTGEIRVLTRMMVVPSAGNKRGGGKELPISKGEILEVIQFTNEEKVLCRNSKRKYGYVKRRYVLQIEKDLYDDVDTLRSGMAQRRN